MLEESVAGPRSTDRAQRLTSEKLCLGQGSSGREDQVRRSLDLSSRILETALPRSSQHASDGDLPSFWG